MVYFALYCNLTFVMLNAGRCAVTHTESKHMHLHVFISSPIFLNDLTHCKLLKIFQLVLFFLKYIYIKILNQRMNVVKMT